MKKALQLIITLFITGSISAQCPWVSVGPSDSNINYTNFGANRSQWRASIALDKNHQPGTAFSNIAHGGKASVLQYNGNSWSFIGSAGFSPGAVSYSSLVHGKGDTAYVAYSDQSDSGRISVMKFNGTNWVYVGLADFTAILSTYVTLTADTAGNLYVAYCDHANNGKATVMMYNGIAWTTMGAAGFTTGAANFLSQVWSHSDTLYVTYSDAGNSSMASVMKFNGIAWMQAFPPVPFSTKTYATVSLAFDKTDVPYIAFDDAARYHLATVAKYNGAQWDSVGHRGWASTTASDSIVQASLFIDTAGVPEILYQFQTGYQSYPEIDKYTGSTWSRVSSSQISSWSSSVAGFGGIPGAVLDASNNNLFISLGTSVNITNLVFKDSANVWLNLSVPGISKSYAINNYLAISKNNILYTDFQDGNDSDKMSVKKFINDQWVYVGQEGFSPGAVDENAITISPVDSMPWVAFRDLKNGSKATVMHFNGTAWVTVGTAGLSTGSIASENFSTAGGLAHGISLAIDKTGMPYVAYVDNSTGNATVMRYNGSSWITTGKTAPATLCLMAKDGMDSLYLAYIYGGKVSVLKYNGTAWYTLGNANFSRSTWYSQWLSFAVAANGTPHVGYGGYEGDHNYTVETFNGSKWVYEGDSTDIVSSACGVQFPYLSTDSYGTPYFAFIGYGGCGIAESPLKFNGTSWVSLNMPIYYTEYGYVSTSLPCVIVGPGDTVYASYSGFSEFVKKSSCAILTGYEENNLPTIASVIVYPNPSNGRFQLLINNPASENILGNPLEKNTVVIYNSMGQKVYCQQFSQSSTSGATDSSPLSINLHGYASGIYLYRVTSENGSIIGTGKLVLNY